MHTVKDVYSYARMDKCAEGGCRVVLENSLSVYCGEILRNRIMDKGKPPMKMCDCIVIDSREEKISIIELKARRGKKKALEGLGKAGDIDCVRGQFRGGLIVLRRMLERITKPKVHVQLVLYTKAKIPNRSEQKRLHHSLANGPHNLGISLAVCGDQLPDNNVAVCVEDLMMQV